MNDPVLTHLVRRGVQGSVVWRVEGSLKSRSTRQRTCSLLSVTQQTSFGTFGHLVSINDGMEKETMPGMTEGKKKTMLKTGLE